VHLRYASLIWLRGGQGLIRGRQVGWWSNGRPRIYAAVAWAGVKVGRAAGMDKGQRREDDGKYESTHGIPLPLKSGLSDRAALKKRSSNGCAYEIST
jgi:hypothetical protein